MDFGQTAASPKWPTLSGTLGETVMNIVKDHQWQQLLPQRSGSHEDNEKMLPGFEVARELDQRVT